MPYELSEEIRCRVNARLKDGAFQDEDQVLREALDALDQMEADRITRWNERNLLATQQSEQGLSRPLDMERVLERVRKRLAEEGIV
jgi:Arc/MetJ-type ribon-helix-helix transcriptional regulator